MTILTVGIDLAKNVFAVHGINDAGKAALVRPAVPRDKLHALIAALPPCVIGMEACSGAHHWARLFHAAGHTLRLIAPKFVTPTSSHHDTPFRRNHFDRRVTAGVDDNRFGPARAVTD